MKLEMSIIALDDCGDFVRVKAQGNTKRDASWQRMRVWEMQVPADIGTRYKLGQKLKIKVSK